MLCPRAPDWRRLDLPSTTRETLRTPDSINRGYTLRRELLDHIIVLNQRHLERLLREYLEQYYHTARPHQGLGGETPAREPREGEGELVSVPVVGGLHHRYLRQAA